MSRGTAGSGRWSGSAGCSFFECRRISSSSDFLDASPAVLDDPGRMRLDGRAGAGDERDDAVVGPALLLGEGQQDVAAAAVVHLQVRVFAIPVGGGGLLVG